MYRISDEVIGHLITIIQAGMLTRQDKTPEMKATVLSIEDDCAKLSDSGSIRFSDAFLQRLAQILGESWATGTNVGDHMRMMRMNLEGSELVPTPEYLEMVKKNLRRQAEEGIKLKEAADTKIEEEKKTTIDSKIDDKS